MESDLLLLGALGKNQRAYVEIIDEVKHKSKPFWRMGKYMGAGKNKKTLSKEMQNISKGASWFFWKLNNIRNEDTNIAVLIPKDETEKKKVLRAYKELHALNIVIRIKRAHYLVNPEVMGPWGGKEKEVQKMWNLLK